MAGFNWEAAKKRALVRRRSRAMPFSSHPLGVTGFRGVHFQKDKNKYRAVIEVCGTRIHLGYFLFGTAAARAYDYAAIAAWGSSAVVNFSDSHHAAAGYREALAKYAHANRQYVPGEIVQQNETAEARP